MQLSIIDETVKGTGDQRRGIQLNQFKAGDKLDARIVKIASSGRTLLQFSGFRAVVDAFAGGREGDVIQFEVLPDENTKSRLNQAEKSTATLSNKSTNLLINKAVRLNMVNEAGGARTEANKGSRLITRSVSQTPPVTQSTNTQAPLPVQSFNIVSSLFKRLIKTLEPLRSEATPTIGSKKPQVTKRLSSGRSTDRAPMIETDRSDRLRDTEINNTYTLFNLGDCPVKMKIYDHSLRSGRDKDQIILKAIFLLNMEYTGAVRTDVLMGTNKIKVNFFVENEDYRTKFAEALPVLRDDLSRHTERCYCHVSVSQTKIHDFMVEEGKNPVNTHFDIRA